MSEIQLTGEQQHAIRRVVEGFRIDKKLHQTLGGYGGTGKTTIVAFLLKILKNWAVCAYTGKAANVLRRKGIPASTIHSLIYRTERDPDGGVEFVLKPYLECEGVIVDEASMVSQDIYKDLVGFGLPILFVGDHGQLEPIGNDFNIMEKPDIRLETIHRNANEIAYFAEWIRNGERAANFPFHSPRYTGRNVKLIRPWDVSASLLCSVEQIVCAFNKTRVSLNQQVRQATGQKGLINPGERILCLRNHSKYKVFNGMQGIVRQVREIKKKKGKLDFESNDTLYHNIPFDPAQFGQEGMVGDYSKDAPLPFDYSYAITCHRFQGDEASRVLVMEQICKAWDHARWAYTAASRAKEILYWQWE